jgi:abortive infection bacteriophage resistance protein
MLLPYTKPHITFSDQLALLKQRGMQVDDEPLALRHLQRIGYYRLKAYWYPMREARPVTLPNGRAGTEILETFKQGATFSSGVDIYVFDKKLRLLFLDAIERIEVALRVDVAYELGKRDPCAHLDPRHLHPNTPAEIDPKSGQTRYDQWRAKAAEAERRGRADWLTEYKALYSSPLPVWMAVELWDFGSLSHLLALMHPTDQQRIAQKYRLPNPPMLTNWIKALAYVRNVCAHHDRLWNLALVIQPKTPSALDMPLLAHFGRHNLSKTRVYSIAAIAQHFLERINPTSSWKDRLKNHWTTFPHGPGLSPSQAGFLQNWQAEGLWR